MLKKIAILTAAAGMLSTSMAVLAEPTLYGRVTFGFESVSGETDADDSQRIDDAIGSRLGVKGSNDLGNGMSVDYLLEYKASDSMSLRHANMTLNGSFGQFRLGKQTGVLYRYIGANTDQSWFLGGSEYYAIASNNMNSDHSLRMKNIAAYRFGAGPGGDDPITFDIQVQSVDMSKAAVGATETFHTGTDENGNMTGEDGSDLDDNVANTIRSTKTAAKAAMDDSESIDSVTFGAATALGPVKFQLAYVDENGSDASMDRSPNLLSLGFRAPLGSAEVRGHMTSVDADVEGRDDNEAWGLLVMNDFGGGYFGMVGVGSYTDGGKGTPFSAAMRGDGDPIGDDGSGGEDTSDVLPAKYTAAKGTHKNDGDQTNVYASLTKSFGGGLSAVAEYSTVTKTVTEMTKDAAGMATGIDDDESTTNTFQLYLVQSF